MSKQIIPPFRVAISSRYRQDIVKISSRYHQDIIKISSKDNAVFFRRKHAEWFPYRMCSLWRQTTTGGSNSARLFSSIGLISLQSSTQHPAPNQALTSVGTGEETHLEEKLRCLREPLALKPHLAAGATAKTTGE